VQPEERESPSFTAGRMSTTHPTFSTILALVWIRQWLRSRLIDFIWKTRGTDKMPTNQPVHVVVEGVVDDPVVKKLFTEAEIQCGDIHVQNGIDKLRERLPAYNQSVRFCSCFVLCDLDRSPYAPSLHHDMIQTFRGGQSPDSISALQSTLLRLGSWLIGGRWLDTYPFLKGRSPPGWRRWKTPSGPLWIRRTNHVLP